MNRLAKSMVLSAALAATTLVPIIEASAGERWSQQRPRHPGIHHRHDATGDLVAAGILGLAFGALAVAAGNAGPETVYVDRYPGIPAYPQPYASYSHDGLEPWTREWFEYCSGRYRSFNFQTGTFRGFDGQDHFCVAN